MTKEQIQEVIDSTTVLKAAQLREDSEEAKATLPRLTLQDIEKTSKEIPIAVTSINDVTVLHHDIQSNGILYTDIAFDYSDVDIEDLPYLPLFSRMVNNIVHIMIYFNV